MNLPMRKSVVTSMGTVSYLEAGQGPDVVLIHGLLVTADDMALGLFDTLARDFHVVSFDRPGHGGSDQTPTQQGSGWAQAAMLHEAGQLLSLNRPILVGHSFGGSVALDSAMLYPDAVTNVLALAPICYPEPRLEQLLLGPRAIPVFGPALARTFGAAMDVALLPVLRRAMFLPQTMPQYYTEEFPFAWATRPEQMVAEAEDSAALWPGLTRSAISYPSCQVGVTILGGTHDLVVNNALHGSLASKAIPKAAFRWVPGAGHMLHHFYQGLIAQTLAGLINHAAEAT